MFCRKCGNKVNPEDSFCWQCGAKLTPSTGTESQKALSVAGHEKETLLSAIEQTFSDNPRLAVKRGDKTDLEIGSVLVDTKWVLGQKKIEYSACLLANEESRIVLYWEMIKEASIGIPIIGSFKAETYKTDSSTISGKVHEVGYRPEGKVVDYNWDFARTRRVVEEIVKGKGWKFKVTLWKNNAMY